MFQSSNGFPSLYVCVSAVLVVVGLWMLLRRSRTRVGNEPRCRGCGYIVIGVAEGRCPECGAVVDAGHVVYGARKRRGKVMAAGVALVAVGVGASWHRVREWAGGVYWYQYKPSYWVMRDFEQGAGAPAPSGNPLGPNWGLWHGKPADLATVAVDELLRRDKAGTLSEGYRRSLDRIGWARFVANDYTVPQNLMNDLFGRWIAGKLSTDLNGRIFRYFMGVSVSAESLGDEVRLRVKFNSTLPGDSKFELCTRATFMSLRIDGKEAEDPRKWFGSGSAVVSHFWEDTVERRVKVGGPGAREVEMDVVLEFCHGRDVLWSERRVLRAGVVGMKE